MPEIDMTPERFRDVFNRIRSELARVVVGQDEIVLHLLTAIFAGGHVLLKGLPGLGRTLIVKTLADVLGLEYGRIQFTPDLIPTDITGAEVLEHHPKTGERIFRFFKGPVFANLVLADEVNRSPARTQAALLEVMQERQITVGGQTYFLPKPFIIIATQNSLDTEGVFHLGEAQVDRFLMMIEQEYPAESEERQILEQTTGTYVPRVERVTGPAEILAMQRFAKEVPVVPSVKEFAMHLVRASRPGQVEATAKAEEKIRLGASPRATQALLLCGKVRALASGRFHVTRHDIVAVARPVMAHRLLLDFRAVAEGATYREVLAELVQRARERTVPVLSRWTRELLKQQIVTEEENNMMAAARQG
ncbi:MAG: MoxR family ATPase [Kiritimatiellae bacterium]|nr:MoxR family ATPase [Kiritimatiellia bacterium]